MRYPPTSARRYGFAILPSSAPFPPAAISLGVSHPPETRKTFARSDFPPFHHSIIPHRAQSLLRLLCAVLLLCGAARAWAEPEIFELRTTAPFTSQEVTLTEAGVNATLGTFSFAQALNETSQLWDGYASLTNIAIDPDSGEEQWTLTANGWSATVEAAAMAAAHEGDHVLWLEFNVPVGSAPPSRSFLIPADRAGHALGLVQTDAAGASPVITALSVEAADVVLSANGGPDFTCRRASALVDLAKPFWVVDFIV